MRDYLMGELENDLIQGVLTKEEAYEKFKNHEFTFDGHKLEAKNAHNIVEYAAEQAYKEEIRGFQMYMNYEIGHGSEESYMEMKTKGELKIAEKYGVRK